MLDPCMEICKNIAVQVQCWAHQIKIPDILSACTLELETWVQHWALPPSHCKFHKGMGFCFSFVVFNIFQNGDKIPVNIKFTILKYNSVVFSIFTMLYNCHHYLLREHFCHT